MASVRVCGTGALANALGHLVEHVLATSDKNDVHAFMRESLGEHRPASVGSADDDAPWPILAREVGHCAGTAINRTEVYLRRAIRQPSSVRTT